jgi:Tol biopolymer transport system component
MAVPAAATLPGRNGAIAYALYYDGYGPCGDMAQHLSCGPYYGSVETASLAGSPPRSLSPCTGQHGCFARAPAWDPGGRRLAYEENGTIFVASADGGGRRALVEGRDPVWSPDGREVAFADADGIHAIAARGGTARRITTGFDQSPDWSTTGKVAFLRRPPDKTEFDYVYELWVVGRRGGTAQRLAAPAYSAPSWSPGGRALLYGGSRGAQKVSARGGASTLVVAGAQHPVWSPDGSRIAYADGEQNTIVIVRPDGSGARTFVGRDTPPRDLSWQRLRR